MLKMEMMGGVEDVKVLHESVFNELVRGVCRVVVRVLGCSSICLRRCKTDLRWTEDG